MSLPINLQPGEKVIKRVHRHFLFILPKSLALILFGIVPVIILLVTTSGNRQFLLIGAGVWALITFIFAYFIWYRYHNDEWIITNQRLVDSNKTSWFNQHLVSTDLINIEDMSVSKSGVLQTILNYGDLRCETAGHESHFVLKGIPDPAGVLDLVDHARDEARRKLGTAYTRTVLQPA